MTREEYLAIIENNSPKNKLAPEEIEQMRALFNANDMNYMFRIMKINTVSQMVELITDMARYSNNTLVDMCILAKNYLLYLARINASGLNILNEYVNVMTTTQRQTSLIDAAMAVFEYKILL